MKKGIVALALAAILVIGLVGVAVAAASQAWFLKDDASGLGGADHTMDRGAGRGSDHAVVGTTAIVWHSNEPALVDVGFGGGTWDVYLEFTDAPGGGHLDEGETITVEIGTLYPGAAFSRGPGMNVSVTPVTREGSFWEYLTPTDPFTVLTGHHLALRVELDTGFVHVDVFGPADSASWVTSPPTDPGFPIFELPTILLMSGGLLALVGYVVYDRRRRQQHPCSA